MAIVIHLDVQMAKRKMKLIELSALVGSSMQALSLLKTGRARVVERSPEHATKR